MECGTVGRSGKGSGYARLVSLADTYQAGKGSGTFP